MVIVTGGAGYIGSHTCKALAASGYTPVTYDNLSTGNRWAVRWGPLEIGDILDAKRLDQVFRRYNPVGLLHFAALALVGESMRMPEQYWRVNVAGALNVLDACRANGVNAFVFSSTCAVYGTPDRLPITETMPKAPINPYGASKLAAEQLLADHDMTHGIRHAVLRYFNAAGADPDGEIGECRAVETHLVPLVLDALAGHRDPISIMGEDYPTPDGTAVRDYIHVSDLASAHVRALDLLMEDAPSMVLNLGTGDGHSVRAVIDHAERIAERPVPCRVAPRRAGDPAELVADPTLAKARLGPGITRNSTLETIIQTAWAWQSGPTYLGELARRARPAKPATVVETSA